MIAQLCPEFVGEEMAEGVGGVCCSMPKDRDGAACEWWVEKALLGATVEKDGRRQAQLGEPGSEGGPL